MSKIIIDTERCKGCYLCIEVCPKGCIEHGSLPNASGYYPVHPVVDGKCTACTLCATVCPDVAIMVIRSVDETDAAVPAQQATE
jgi:2-oxoglutarate ferredoxin oxidoreductase subunit delta